MFNALASYSNKIIIPDSTVVATGRESRVSYMTIESLWCGNPSKVGSSRGCCCDLSQCSLPLRLSNVYNASGMLRHVVTIETRCLGMVFLAKNAYRAFAGAPR